MKSTAKTGAKYALTGATGLVGSTIRKMFPDRIGPVFSGDIRDATAVERFIYDLEGIAGILHLAAVVPKQIADQDPVRVLEVNVLGTVNVLEALRKLKATGADVPWLFYASTSHVYASSEKPLRETDLLAPFTIYGRTKLQAEEWVRIYQDNFGILSCTGRIFSFTGPGQPSYYFVPAMVKKITQAPAGGVVQVGGITGTRDFLRVDQVASTIMGLAERRHVGVINIGTGVPAPLESIVREVARRAERTDLKIEVLPDPPTHLNANVDRLKELGLAAEFSLSALVETQFQ
ncbi:MAG: NAD(P)-dependent oxidoreductase [Bdellovibrionaceae bacterium]|nr:NAD(P)-dependent oxidoreductase [Pseudobdellovibrionaceae bacterium]